MSNPCCCVALLCIHACFHQHLHQLSVLLLLLVLLLLFMFAAAALQGLQGGRWWRPQLSPTQRGPLLACYPPLTLQVLPRTPLPPPASSQALRVTEAIWQMDSLDGAPSRRSSWLPLGEPIDYILPSIFAFRFVLQWPADSTVLVYCPQVGRFMWLQPAAIGFCLSGLCPSHLLPSMTPQRSLCCCKVFMQYRENS